MFIKNKYSKWYFNIVTSAKSRQSINHYTEKHHIIPKSLGGTDSIDNLVALTGKEHFICHLLLTKMTAHEHRAKMVYAAWRMTVPGRNEQKRHKVSSRMYESIKTQRAEYLKSLKGEQHPNFGRKTGRTSTDFTDDWKKNLSDACKGRVPWNQGVTHSEKTKKLQSDLAKNRPKQKCPHCHNIIAGPSNFKRWHGDNCKSC